MEFILTGLLWEEEVIRNNYQIEKDLNINQLASKPVLSNCRLDLGLPSHT